MISVLACDRNAEETKFLRENCGLHIARNSDELLNFQSISGDGGLHAFADDEQLLDIFYYEFQKGQTIDGLRSFRKKYGDSMFMLIADNTVSPLEYLKPGIAPDSLLLRPCSREMLEHVNAELMSSFFEKFRENDTSKSFVVDTKEEKLFIPYHQIYYFEARAKKLFVRTRTEEYPFYDTIEALLEQLPEQFKRCHRSYIVNTLKIKRIVPADNYIELSEDIGVPISRSYKSSFRGGGAE